MVNTRSGAGIDIPSDNEGNDTADEEPVKVADSGFNFADYVSFTPKNVVVWEAAYYGFFGVMFAFFQDKFQEMHGMEGGNWGHDESSQGTIKLLMIFRGFFYMQVAALLYAISETRTGRQMKAVMYSNIVMAIYCVYMEYFGQSRMEQWGGVPENTFLIHAGINLGWVALQCYANKCANEDNGNGEGDFSTPWKIAVLINIVNFVTWAFFANDQCGLYANNCEGQIGEVWADCMPVQALLTFVSIGLAVGVGVTATAEQTRIACYVYAGWACLFAYNGFVNKEVNTNAGFKDEMNNIWMVICGGIAYLFNEEYKKKVAA